MNLKTLVILLLHSFLSAIVYSYRYEHYFNPDEEEYDPLKFDPDTLFGAPLGGWSRASRSRLAALPLRLVGDSVFWKDKEETPQHNTDRPEDDELDQTKEVESAGPYFTMRDGMGRQFACRIYDEVELTPESMAQSMFHAPIFRMSEGEDHTDSGLLNEDDPLKYDEGEAGSLDAEGLIITEQVEDSDPEDDIDVEIILTHSLGEYLEGRGIERKTQLDVDNSKHKYDYQIQADAIKPILDNLKQLAGTCASLHTGWWSYEWCNVDKITQFHVQLQGNQLGEVLSVQDLMPEFVLQSISTIGTFTKRKIVVETKNEHFISDTLFNMKTETDEGSTVEAELSDLVVVDSFENGEYCDEVKANRKVEVQLRCCRQKDILSSLKKGSMQNLDFFTTSFNKDTDEVRSILLDVQERSVCDYVAHVCTNVLCENWFEEATPDAEVVDVPSKPNEVVVIQRDDSIRSILDKTMEGHCLKKNEGWWTYRFCYQSVIQQYHESLDIDGGVMKSTIEAENVLGKYDPVSSERFSKEEEINYVVFHRVVDPSKTRNSKMTRFKPQPNFQEQIPRILYRNIQRAIYAKGRTLLTRRSKAGR